MRARAAGGEGLQVRIGMSSGEVVAGVVGKRKFHYDVWGEAVNVAARMESLGEPGRIQVSGATWERIRDEVPCVERGQLEVKGKGTMRPWFLA